MNWERLGWMLITAAAVALERHTLRNQSEERNDTASEVVRIGFFTDTLVGKTVFQIATRGAYEWFVPHILSQGTIRRMRGQINA